MNGLAFIVPGRLDQIAGGHLFDRRVVEGLRARGRSVTVVELTGDDAASAFAALPDGLALAIDGTVLPLLVDAIPANMDRLRLVAFVHHPLADETGLSSVEQDRLARLETALLPLFRGVLCPSRRTAVAVQGGGVPADRIAVTPPGVEKPQALPPLRNSPVRNLLCVANVIPRKGHDLLIAALAQLRDLDWQLECIGSLSRDPATAAALRRQIAAAGLDDRVILAGECSPGTLSAAYRDADAFVLASYHEGYGMVCAEAMAHGLPQIITAGGAIPEVVPREAGLLIPPGDVEALADALRRLLTEPGLAYRLATGAREAAGRLLEWPQAIDAWEAAFDRLASTAADRLV